MYVRYTALFTWPRESMSRNRGVISSSNATAPPQNIPSRPATPSIFTRFLGSPFSSSMAGRGFLGSSPHTPPDPSLPVSGEACVRRAALPGPNPIQISTKHRAVPDARVLADCDVARDHGGFEDIDHRCGQGGHGLKAFGARFLPAVEPPRLPSRRWSHSRPRLTLPILSPEGGRSSGHRMLILDRQGFNTDRTGCLSHPWRAASRNGIIVSSTSLR